MGLHGAFMVWRLLNNRLLTLDQLLKRNIQIQDQHSLCCFCRNCLETSQHLFLKCVETSSIWCAIFKWMGMSTLLPNDVVAHLYQVGSQIKGKKAKRWRWLIWFIGWWKIWNQRNNIIFKGQQLGKNKLVEEIRITTWQWVLYKKENAAGFMFSSWLYDSILSLSTQN